MFPGIANGNFWTKRILLQFRLSPARYVPANGVPTDFLKLINYSFFHNIRESASWSASTLIGLLVYCTPVIILVAIGLIAAVVLRELASCQKTSSRS